MNGRAPGLERLAWQLESLSDAELLSAGASILEGELREGGSAVQSVVSVLDARLTGERRFFFARRLLHGGTPLAVCVAARLLAGAGDAGAAQEALDRAVDAVAAPDPELLLARARVRARAASYLAAGDDLRAALCTWPPFSFIARCERLMRRVVEGGGFEPRRACRIALLSSSTTALLATALRAAAFRDQIALAVYEGAYGAYRQEILDPGSGLYSFRPDFVVLLVNHRDLALPPTGGRATAEAFARELYAAWATLRDRCSCHVLQVAFDIPTGGAWGYLEARDDGRRRAVSAANQMLFDEALAGVSVLDPSRIQLELGAAYSDEKEWLSNRQYPSTAALPLFADHVLAQVRAVLGLTSKVLVCDLDNTLWGGVIGEDGLGGIKLGPPTALGEAYVELQRYLKELQQRGILLAICSKNNPADAELPLKQHDAMLLRLDDFVAVRTNWQDKATNLQEIAAELSLGLDSFVFLDDNPIERSWVRRRLPQVVVPECGDEPLTMLKALRRGLYFEVVDVTGEDLARHGSYKLNAQRQAVARAGGSLADFLAGLDMRAAHGPVDEATLVRVTQLINKTNQFNLTARRYTQEQVRARAASPEWWCRWFRLRDKFADHGLVGVLLVSTGSECWVIDTFLLSCRVLGRQVEEFMCRVLVAAARRAGVAVVRGDYVPTAKNGLVADLYPRLGFVADAGSFLLSLTADEREPSSPIADVSGGQ